jgi:hypothetical protein
MANRLPAITLEGDAELMSLIDSLPGRILTESSTAIRSVSKKVVADARSRLRKDHGLLTGQLKKSLGVRKVLTYRKEQRVVAYIGPRRGFAVQIRTPVVRKDAFGRPSRISYSMRKHDPFNIAHLVEFGHRVATQSAATKLLPDHVRMTRAADHVAPRPFLRPAVDANRGNFLEAMKKAIRKQVERRAAGRRAKA